MADPMSYYQDPNLTAAREEALSSASTLGGYQTAAASLPQKLEQAIQEKLDYNKDLINDKNTAQANYIAAPAVAREKYQDIFNPFTRESLVAQEKAGAYIPYANLVDLLGERKASVKDTIAAAVSAYQGAVQAAENAAVLARQKYQDLFAYAKELASTSLAQQQESRLGAKDEKDPLQQIIEAAILRELGLGDNVQDQMPTESEPLYTPKTGEGTRSPGGQWIFHLGEWMMLDEGV